MVLLSIAIAGWLHLIIYISFVILFFCHGIRFYLPIVTDTIMIWKTYGKDLDQAASRPYEYKHMKNNIK